MSALFALMTLFAEGDAAAPGGPNPMFMILLIMAAGFFILVMPMRRQQKQQQNMLSGLKPKDKVITNGGIIGVVLSIPDKKDDDVKEDEVVLRMDESGGTRIRVLKSSIVRVYPAGAGQPAANSDKK